jgi:uncharacterized protein GlcG (DUF336 family)
MTHYTEQWQITTEVALRAVDGAVQHAIQLGIKINVAVCDASGTPMAFLRMNGAPTSQWVQILSKHSDGVRLGLPTRPRFVQFGGGLPINVNGTLVGGIGVSGGSEQQDEECARIGLIAAEIET